MSVGPLGFGESEWKQIVMGRAQRVVSSRIRRLISNDLDTDSATATATSLTGTVTFDTDLTGGVARVRTGGSLVGGAYAVMFNAGQSILVRSPNAESWYAHARCWIKDAPLALTDFFCIGLQDMIGGAAQNVAFGLLGTYNTTLLTLEMTGAGTTSYATTVVADLNGFHDYGIGYSYERDAFYALVDNDVVLELAGPFANLTANPCFFYSAAVATTALGGQDVELWVDEIATGVEKAQ